MRKMGWLAFLVITGFTGLLHAAQEQAEVTDKATVYIYRYRDGGGKWGKMPVYVDEKEVAKVLSGTYFILQLPPGKHTIRSTIKTSGMETDFKAGQVEYIRVQVANMSLFRWGGRIDQVMPDQGKFEVKAFKYLQPDKITDKKLVLSAAPASGGEKSQAASE